MANQIKLRRGLESGIPVLADGEPGWTTDTKRLFIGQGGVNRLVGEADFLKLGGGALSGFLTLHADPSSDMHAATKRYVDATRQGLDIKASVRVATTGNITLSGLQTIDGVSVQAGDRVLVKNQSDAKDNGIYVAASGAWSRAADADSDDEVTPGMFCFVEEGTTNSDTGWVLITDAPITLGTTNLNFTKFTSASDVEAGDGLVKSGNVLHVNPGHGIEIDNDAVTVKLDGGTLSKGASGLRIASGTAQYQILVTGAGPNYNPSYQPLANFAGTGLEFTNGQFVVKYGYTAGTALEGNSVIDGGTW